MPPIENAPGPEAEGVECLHRHADTDANSTAAVLVQLELTSQRQQVIEPRQRKPVLGRRYSTEEIEAAAMERVCAWRMEWSQRRIREGLHESERRISKDEAARRLKAAYRLMEGGAE